MYEGVRKEAVFRKVKMTKTFKPTVKIELREFKTTRKYRKFLNLGFDSSVRIKMSNWFGTGSSVVLELFMSKRFQPFELEYCSFQSNFIQVHIILLRWDYLLVLVSIQRVTESLFNSTTIFRQHIGIKAEDLSNKLTFIDRKILLGQHVFLFKDKVLKKVALLT